MKTLQAEVLPGMSCHFLPGSIPTQACFSPLHCKQYTVSSSRGQVSKGPFTLSDSEKDQRTIREDQV